jgi:hypothetical protein
MSIAANVVSAFLAMQRAQRETCLKKLQMIEQKSA